MLNNTRLCVLCLTAMAFRSSSLSSVSVCSCSLGFSAQRSTRPTRLRYRGSSTTSLPLRQHLLDRLRWRSTAPKRDMAHSPGAKRWTAHLLLATLAWFFFENCFEIMHMQHELLERSHGRPLALLQACKGASIRVFIRYLWQQACGLHAIKSTTSTGASDRSCTTGQCESSLRDVRDVFSSTSRHISDHSESMLIKQHERDLATWRVRIYCTLALYRHHIMVMHLPDHFSFSGLWTLHYSRCSSLRLAPHPQLPQGRWSHTLHCSCPCYRQIS